MQIEESKNERVRPLTKTIKKILVKIKTIIEEKTNHKDVNTTKENSKNYSVNQPSSPDESKTTENP